MCTQETKADLRGFSKNGPSVVEIVVLFIKLGKGNPEHIRLPYSLCIIDRLDCLSVCHNLLVRIVLEQGRALEPLIDIVRVLAQLDRADENWPPFGQVLEACQSHVKVVLVVLWTAKKGAAQEK